mgnify:FL=1
MWYMKLLYAGLVPDPLLRLALRMVTARKIRQLDRLPQEVQENRRQALFNTLENSPIAIHTDLPNVQHYEVPPAFFQLVLGDRLKYSCCLWPEGVDTLEEAEESMLELTCQRGDLKDGMTVLDLGCGWGSLSLWIAENYPACRVLALSNSRDQIGFILDQARARGYQHLQAQVMDVNQLELNQTFDRVFSIEMFEHMKNYRLLMGKISRLLSPQGKLFVHLFSHRLFAYEYDAEDENNWMAQTFFTGGTMPSDDLLLHYQQQLQLLNHWRVSGIHYQRTLRAWRERMESRRELVREVLAGTYGPEQVQRWWCNWRLFFLACEETWGYREGREYLVTHYLFQKSS